MLRTVFTIAPIAFGLDKFTNVLTDWPSYLAPRLDAAIPGDAHFVANILIAVAVLAIGLKIGLTRSELGVAHDHLRAGERHHHGRCGFLRVGPGGDHHH